MQIEKISAPRTAGWFTDLTKAASKLLPGQNPTVVNVTAPAAAGTPAWVLPAIAVGGAVIVFAMVKKR